MERLPSSRQYIEKNIVIWTIAMRRLRTFAYELHVKRIRKASVPRGKTIKSGQNMKKIQMEN